MEYRKRNHEKIKGQCRKHTILANNAYIKNLLRLQGYYDHEITPEIIMAKREIIKSKRILWEIKKLILEKEAL